VKKVTLICVAAVVMFFGAYLFLLNKTLGKNESSEQLVKKEDQTAVTNDYSSSGAIAKAKALSEGKDYQDEARELFGIELWSYQEDEYQQFKEKLLVNSQLSSVFQNAKREKVTVFLSKKFGVGTGWVEVSTGATDDRIVEFLNNSMVEAKARRAELKSLNKEASQYGLYLWSHDTERYKQIQSRLSTNKDLASAFRLAAREKVIVYLDNKFSVNDGSVYVNIDATDEEIVAFLLGK